MKKNKVEQDFIKNGFIISKIENKKNFLKIEKKIYLIIKKFINYKKKSTEKYLFNNIHKYLDNKKLNNLRLTIYKKLNSDYEFYKTYFSLAAKTIEKLVGTEIAAQNKINFSIQMPNDNSSKLEMHADSLSGESKFQVVLWVPLTNVFKTKSMYVFDKNFSKKTIEKLDKYKYDGMDKIYNKHKNKKKFISVKRGEFLLFSPNLLHGNVTNLTNETRISMNSRFKNLFSTYSNKSQFGKRIGYFYVPLTIKPATQFALNFNIPDEF